MIEQKAWGTTELLYADRGVQLARICVVKGGFSSIHRHRNKHNLFWIVRGRLAVRIFLRGNYNEPAREKILDANENALTFQATFTALNNTWHQFEALEDVVCLEKYVPAAGRGDIDVGDIERLVGELGVGGVRHG